MSGTVLGLVPARGGSKGVPRKNIRLLADKPLLAYTATAAKASGVLDRLILSTDDSEIARVGKSLGFEVPFLRPSELAQDETPMLSVIIHAIDFMEKKKFVPKYIVLLQPTSPLRQGHHISDAVEILRTTGCDSVVSVTKLPLHCSPDYVMRIEGDQLCNFLQEGIKITRRQDAREAYVRNGTVYAFRRDVIIEQRTIYGVDCRPLILSEMESISIDTYEDWVEAEQRLLRNRVVHK